MLGITRSAIPLGIGTVDKYSLSWSLPARQKIACINILHMVIKVVMELADMNSLGLFDF